MLYKTHDGTLSLYTHGTTLGTIHELKHAHSTPITSEAKTVSLAFGPRGGLAENGVTTNRVLLFLVLVRRWNGHNAYRPSGQKGSLVEEVQKPIWTRQIVEYRIRGQD